ncbi:MAG: hypothetical protein C0504_09490 [Candidatus Solibacter sp.]|nr:hypothetical protein [Candidatus Solibacter sp.]
MINKRTRGRCRQEGRRRGFVLIVAAVACVILIGCVGMAVDLGRLYLIKSEAQNYVDSAALRAAVLLDGTSSGLMQAEYSAAQSRDRYDMASRPFTNTVLKVSPSVDGPWYSAAGAPLKSRFVRVSTSVNAPMYFIQAVTLKSTGTVTAVGTGAQVEKRVFTEGLFPFSPFAHNANPPHYGLTPGVDYTMRWPAKPKLGGKSVCPGDQFQEVIDTAEAAGGEERGFIEETSASRIRDTIINDFQTVTRTVGELVDLTGGAKQTMLEALETRIEQDTDAFSTSYSDYVKTGIGNGRRLVGMPINDGGTPRGVNHRIVSIGLFFIKPTGYYGSGGGQGWCAEYVGAYVEGSNRKGVEDSGAWVVRLVR